MRERGLTGLPDAADAWRRDGRVVLPGCLDGPALEAVRRDLAAVYPSAGEDHTAPGAGAAGSMPAVSPARSSPCLSAAALRRGVVTQAATLVTECLKELPGHQGYLEFAAEVGAELPPRARELLSERARILSDAP